MTSPISNQGTARLQDRATRNSPAQAAQVRHDPITSFTRTSPRTTTSATTGTSTVQIGQKPQPIAAAMTGVRTLNDTQLKAIGAEILHLYQNKVIGTGGRRLATESAGEKWSIRGANIENLVIHTQDGLIQLRADGMPTRNISLPIQSWKGLELGLNRALTTLRDVEKPQTLASTSASV